MQADVTRRPGRPKSEAKAGAIQEAAVHLFMTDGMERTSMDAIAAAAGVSKQTVYSHFRSKDDLFRSCVASKIATYGLDASNLRVSSNTDTLLKHIGRQYLTLLSDMGVIRMFRLMASEADTHPETVKSFYESGPWTTMRNIADIVSVHLPEISDERPHNVASDFLSLVRGAYFIEFLMGVRPALQEDEMDAHLDRCVTQIRSLYEFLDEARE
ncbi:MAG: TetR/AcrR family transcriptional regulator [Woeseiaceae bacterium]|nr:TetR/AcrR family transcriptional regulator [Woeseiaceae bacterium]